MLPSSYKKYFIYQNSNESDFQLQANKTYVWYKKANDNYKAGTVESENENSVSILTQTGEIIKYTREVYEDYKVNPSKFDGVEDCSKLPYLSDASVLHNLVLRYTSDVIYTYSGLFLVTLNPYKSIPIYGSEIVDFYRSRTKEEVPPHVFSLSDYAYHSMLEQKKNQSILITGESGAGKTENTKKVIQYLASIAGKDVVGHLEKQLLSCNPLLEALGNAKTTKNNNSSRFGKFIKITFNNSGHISGASITSYLLERSRVVFQATQERSFHIFYQLCSSDAHREKYKLGPVNSYRFLNRSGCTTVDKIDDKVEFQNTLDAIDIMNFKEEEKDTMFSVIAAILHLGNVKFTPQNNGEACSIVDKTEIQIAAELLSVNAMSLEDSLINPRIKAGKDFVKTNLNPDKASNSRDALCMALYGRMFLWIVDKINETLQVNPHHLSIGILDIAGFEIFHYNSLEQLCINYTNECLQQFFNNHMFTLEQEEYKREKIEWKMINFGIDSQATIDLIENRSKGVLTILDEESVFPGASDNSFMSKLLSAHEGKQPKFRKAKVDSSPLTFTIKHYAGDVEYNVTQWLEKNKDFLLIDLESCIKSSLNSLISAFMSQESIESSVGNSFDVKSARTGSRKSGVFKTVSNQYREQLRELLDTLNITNPHFIRCILPNRKQLAGKVKSAIILDQLRCNGVLEGIRIARKGYPNRMIYSDFLKRYYMLGSGIAKKTVDPKPLVSKLVEALVTLNVIKDPNEYTLGLNKIFFKTGVLGRIEEAREKKISEQIPLLEALARAYITRKSFVLLLAKNEKTQIIQQSIHAWVKNKNYNWLNLFKKARPYLKYRNIENELAEKQAEIERLKAMLQEESAKRLALENSIQLLQMEVDKLKFSLITAKGEYDGLSTENSGLKSKCGELEERIERMKQSMNESESVLDELNSTKEDMKKKLMKIQSDLDLEVQENERIKAQYERAEKELLASRQEIQELEQEEAKLKKRVTELEHEYDDVSKEKEGELLAKTQLTRLRNKLQDDLHDALEQMELLRSERDNLQKNLSALERQFGEMRHDFESESQAKVSSESTVKKLQRELDETADELEKQIKRADLLDKQSRQLEMENAQLAGDLEFARNENSIQSRKLSKLTQDLEDVQRRSYEDTESNVYAVKKMDLQIEDLNVRLEEAHETISKLEREKKRLAGDVENALSEMENDRNALQQNIKERKSLESDLFRTKGQIEEERSRVEALNKSNSTLESEVKHTARQLEAQTEACKLLEKELKRVKSELTSNSDASGDRENKLRSDFERVKRELMDQISLLEDELDELKNGKSSIDRRARELESKLEDADAHNESLTTELQQANTRAARLESELKESKQSMSTDNSKAESSIQSLKQQLADSESSLSDERSKVKKLNKLQQSLTSELEECQSTCSTLQSELSRSEKSRKRAEDEARKLQASVQSNESKAQIASTIDEWKTKLIAVEQQLQKTEREKQMMSANLNESQSSSEELLMSKQALEKQNEKLKLKMSELATRSEELQDLEEQYRQLDSSSTEKITQIENNLTIANEQLAQSREENRALTSEVNELKLSVENLSTELARVSKQHKRSNLEYEQLKVSLDDAQKQIGKYEKKIQSLSSTNQIAKSEQAKRFSDLEESYQRQQRELKLELDQKTKVVHDLEAEMRNLERSMSEQKESCEVQTEQNLALRNELQELKRQYGENQELLEELKSKLESEQSAAAALSETNNQIVKKLRASEALQQEAEFNAQSAITAQKDSVKKIEAQERRLKKLESSTQLLNESLREASEKLQQSQSKNRLLHTELENMKDKFMRLEVENNTRIVEFSELENEVSLLKNQYAQERTTRTSLEQENRSLASRVEESETMVEELINQRNSTNRKLDAQKSQLTALQEESFELKSRLIDLENAKSEADQNLIQVQGRLDKEVLNCETAVNMQKQSQAQLEELRAELGEVKTNLANSERALSVCESEVVRVNVENQRLLQESTDSQQSNEKLESQLKSAYFKTLELQKTNTKTVETNNRLAREVKELSAQVSDLNEKLNEANNVRVKLEKQLAKAKVEFPAKAEELARVTEELRALTDAHEKLKKKAHAIQSMLNI